MPLLRSTDLQGRRLPTLPPVLEGIPHDEILLNNNFDQGIEGWHTQTGANPPTLSDHAVTGHSLRLATGEYGTPYAGSESSIFKRVAETFLDGYIMWCGWLAFRGKQEHSNPGSISLYIDHQHYDDTRRSFSKLALRRLVTTSGEPLFSPRWSLVPDSIPATPPTNVYVDIPNSKAAVYPPEEGKGAVPGWNVNHGGFAFMGMVVSCNAGDNQTSVGIGRYWRAIIGNQIVDISSLKTGGTVTENGENTHSGEGTTTGSGAQNPQVDTSFTEAPNHVSSFSGGLNFGFNISNSTINGAPAALFADHVFACHFPAGTVFPTGSEG